LIIYPVRLDNEIISFNYHLFSIEYKTIALGVPLAEMAKFLN